MNREYYGDKPTARRFKPFAKTPAEFSVESYCEPFTRQFDFRGDKHDTLLIKAHRGTGKTKRLLQYVQALPVKMGVIVVSPRRSFTSRIKSKLGKTIVDYRDVRGQIAHPRVVIQFESLLRLELPVGQPFVLIIHESESVISQIENQHLAATEALGSCWEKLEWLVANASKMIAIDALADYRTFALLTQGRRQSPYMQHNTFVSENGLTDIFYASHETFLAAVYGEAAGARENPFVVMSTSKKHSDAIVARLRELNPLAKIQLYSSDFAVGRHRALEDASELWYDVDILVYTSTVDASCSFRSPRFKKLFAFFSDRSMDYKASIRMIGRMKDIASRECHIFVKETRADLPRTVQEVEDAMLQQDEICRLAAMPRNMPDYIRADGKLAFEYYDLYAHLHIGNIVHRCQSQDRFRLLFQRHRAMMGVKLVQHRLDKTPAADVKTPDVRADEAP